MEQQLLNSPFWAEPRETLLYQKLQPHTPIKQPPLALGRQTDANPRETQKLPSLIILGFFSLPPSCQEYFCVCRKLHLQIHNISLCRAWNRCVCCNIDCEHWHPMWFSFLPVIFEANWIQPAQMCLAGHSYFYFHSGSGANGGIYGTWNKLSWLRGLPRHSRSRLAALGWAGIFKWVFFFLLLMLFSGWWLQWGLVGLRSAELGAWLSSLKCFAVWCGFLVGYWEGVVRNLCVVRLLSIIKK